MHGTTNHKIILYIACHLFYGGFQSRLHEVDAMFVRACLLTVWSAVHAFYEAAIDPVLVG